MSAGDRARWDDRYLEGGSAPQSTGPPPEFAGSEHLIPRSGSALEIACGRGRGAAWLGERGLDYLGVDVSPVAIDLARDLIEELGLGSRCRFQVHDLDDGLPEGPGTDLILCYKFRDASLDGAIVDRLKPGGTLAIAVLSEVDRGPGAFRSRPSELLEAFTALDVRAHHEVDGMAWLVARKP